MRDSRESGEAWESGEPWESGESREPWESKESGEPWESGESGESGVPWESREPRSLRSQGIRGVNPGSWSKGTKGADEVIRKELKGAVKGVSMGVYGK